MQSLISKFTPKFRRKAGKQGLVFEDTKRKHKDEANRHEFSKSDQVGELKVSSISKIREANTNVYLMNRPTKLQLIPSIVDDRAAHNPEKVFASIPLNNDDLSLGFRDISYLEFRKAVDKAAYWLEEKLGTPEQLSNGNPESGLPTFAFYGTRDLRYNIFAVAAMKAGFQMLSPSLLCAMDAHVHLVEKTGCQKVVCIPSTLPLAKQIVAKSQQSQSPHRISTFVAPEFLKLLPLNENTREVDKCYPYKKSWEEACNQSCLILHTSGSTGMPKVVYYSQRMLANPIFHCNLPSIKGQSPLLHEWKGRILTTVPPFHLLGYAGFLISSVYLDCVGVMGPPDRPMTVDLADEIHRYGRLDGGVYHPSLLQDLVRDENKRRELGNLKFIFYSGSPLETSTGQWLASNFGTVRNCLGSTESFSWPIANVVDQVNDWNYIHFHPIDGLEFKPVGLSGATSVSASGSQHADRDDNDELYELIVHRTPETETLTNVFFSLPQLTEWSTKDLWKPHPDPVKGDHWLYQGRVDDLVVLSGEIKMYAASLEDKICSAHSLVRTAVIGGNQRKWPFLLLELAESTIATATTTTSSASSTTILDEIWPHLNEVNIRYTHESVRLQRSLVLVADKARPFVRLAKGSVARGPTLGLYKEDIDNLYKKMEE